jgi:hypothetical protein
MFLLIGIDGENDLELYKYNGLCRELQRKYAGKIGFYSKMAEKKDPNRSTEKAAIWKGEAMKRYAVIAGTKRGPVITE